ncbi:transmembrane 9 superfamily protein member 4 [Nannizzia gypsea CBS 118893]|uniref:Transmembrane 9 superfamily member n=1 Tax=Arthroderma gypseum (strain ATCC MYA-4604 / CBS 118893) TaxID=535722 RepID=E5QZ57_ARTGP|nr:transmembrane 9 superfamily protein member 4 [Nannizzia gypsea CBS 118893]EFQ97289.1 transmembrane 9 superfamily protein member 4 [Nannizzia gypsea CBS 118893]
MDSTAPLAYLLSFLLLLLLPPHATAFYVPGYSIQTYQDGQRIPVLVNKIFSDNSQLQYAYSDLPFACPSTAKAGSGGHSIPLNLGEVLRGDRISLSDFELEMGQNVACKPLCTREIGRRQVNWAKSLISDGFVAEWIVDNLPGATSFITVDKTQKYYTTGFKLGYQAVSSASRRPTHYIHNHFTFVIRWRDAPRGGDGDGRKVIVGFEIYPKSISREGRKQDGCPGDVHTVHHGFELHLQPNNTRLAQQYPGASYLPENDEVDDGAKLSIPYTYSVFFKREDKVEWANRWDLYLYSQQDGTTTHWLSLLNSLVICGVLSATVLVIYRRTGYGDSKGRTDGLLEDGKARLRSRKSSGSIPVVEEKSKSSGGLVDGGVASDDDLSSDDDFDDASSWKRLHGDVFRTPAYSGLLAPFVGSGMQLLFMATGLLSLSCLGVLNPSFRGGFISVGVGLFTFAGIFSGYFSARLYRTFGGMNWRKNTFITALLFPGLVFSLIFVLNLFVWAQASSTALPFGTLVGLLALWLLIQVPLVYAGSWYGYERSKPWSHPTRTSAIPRQIPAQPWYSGSLGGILLSGFAPFAVLFVELVFLFRNMLQDKGGYYYVFGYLSIVGLLTLLSIAEVAIITTYTLLCAENHRWWWHSFMVGGSSAVWVFMYCIWYFCTKLHIHGFVSSLLFFSYSFLGCAVYGLLTGTVGFLAAYIFVRRIYSSVKAD